MFKSKILVIVFLFTSSSFVFAGEVFGGCTKVFYKEKPPVLIRANEKNERAMCIGAFAVLYNVDSKTAIYSAERLDRRMGSVTKGVKRKNNFHPEIQLRPHERSNLIDYSGNSRFDRGHLTPAGDATSQSDMDQTFSLANIVPQYKFNNEHPWKNVEDETRKYARKAKGNVYVITGPVFGPKMETIGPNKVWVPNYLFKLVYDEVEGKSWAYWIPNDNHTKRAERVSYEELVKRTNIEFIYNQLGLKLR